MYGFRIPLEILRAFSRDDWRKLVIAYDFDDILHPLVGKVMQQMGLDINLIIDYNFEKCLPPDLAQEALRIAYSNRLYDNIEFFPGVEVRSCLATTGRKRRISH